MFTDCRLGVQNVPSTCPDIHFEKTGGKDFWRRITRDEIITDYNTKAVNVNGYQKRDNNSDTAGKGYKLNSTTIYFKGSALFDPSVVEKAF